MPEAEQVLAEIDAVMADRPALCKVNSHKGVTNLRVSYDVIIDASIPAGGKRWGPDSYYAPIHDESLEYFKEKGVLHPCRAGIAQISASWRKRLKNSVRTRRRSKFRMMGLCMSFWRTVTFCWSTQSRSATSGSQR